MKNQPKPQNNTRIGFHYLPDSLHYRNEDLQAWLPELKSLGASWLTLVAPEHRAIPETFIRGLLVANIEPILHFQLSLENPINSNELKTLLSSYKSWGVNYITLFDRPNNRSKWEGASWARQDLVERFLDIYLPLAECVCSEDMIPIFPPLEPGGDYWDTAFLRSALVGIQRRGHGSLLEKLCLGAYAWADNLSLNWGAGGPERWPGARPYYTPPGEEDHIGFRIFDWYAAVGRAVLGETPPIFILGGGSHIGDFKDKNTQAIDKTQHSERNLNIAKLISGETATEADGKYIEVIPDYVMTCNFYTLAAPEDDENKKFAWYQSDGNVLPIVQEMQAWHTKKRKATPATNQASEKLFRETHKGITPTNGNKPITHYVLLPSYDWGIADWHLDVTREFVKKYKATIGFSIEEALQAVRVTVIGGESTFPIHIIDQLKSNGCEVEQISGDGTEIASILENL